MRVCPGRADLFARGLLSRASIQYNWIYLLFNGEDQAMLFYRAKEGSTHHAS